MITYAPGYWGVGLVFRIRGSVIPKCMKVAVPCMIVTVVLHILFREYLWESFRLPEKPTEPVALMKPDDFGSKVISSFMFVLGFLIVFRANQAYSRWWEGGSLLLQVRGEWFNAFSSSMALCTDKPEMREEVSKFRQQLLRLVSLLFGSALVQIQQMPNPTLEIIGLEEFDEQHLDYLKHAHDKAELVLQWIQKLVVQANQNGIIVAPPPVLARIYNQLGSGIVSLSTARKISEFPIPFPVAQLISILLMAHWFLTVGICAVSIEVATRMRIHTATNLVRPQ